MAFQETDHITLNKPTSKHFCRFQGETGVYPGRLGSTANLILTFFPYTGVGNYPHEKWATDYVCLPFNLHEIIVSVTTVRSLSNLHLVALAAIILYREGILALIMTGTAEFAGLHVAHGGLQGTSLVREYLGMAIGTFVCLSMEFVTEGGLAG